MAVFLLNVCSLKANQKGFNLYPEDVIHQSNWHVSKSIYHTGSHFCVDCILRHAASSKLFKVALSCDKLAITGPLLGVTCLLLTSPSGCDQ